MVYNVFLFLIIAVFKERYKEKIHQLLFHLKAIASNQTTVHDEYIKYFQAMETIKKIKMNSYCLLKLTGLGFRNILKSIYFATFLYPIINI